VIIRTTIHHSLRSLRKSLARSPFGYLQLAIGYYWLLLCRAASMPGRLIARQASLPIGRE
jgi:hypothetical protein